MALPTIWNFVWSWYKDVVLPWISQYWAHVEPYYELARSLLLHGTVVFIVTSFCLYVSAFLFGVVYYYNMPTMYHTYDLNFHYDRKCIQQHRNYLKSGQVSASMYKSECYPTATIDFDSLYEKKVLTAEQPHQVYLSLELPESDVNMAVGMFMTKMTYGRRISSQPATLRYRPSVVRYAYMATFWPLFLFNIMESKQTLDIPLFEKIRFENPLPQDIKMCQQKLARQADSLHEEKFCSHRRAEIEIDYPDIQIYSAHLHLTATFSGLQRFMFQWPVFSFLVGTAIFFVPVLASMLVAIYLILRKPPWISRRDNEEMEGNRETVGRAHDAPCEGPLEPVAHSEHEEDGGCDSSTPTTPSSSIEMIGSPPEGNSDATLGPDSDLPPDGDAENGGSAGSEMHNEEVETLLRRRT